ncbi:hypothetical protein [Curtobacterium sp. MCSS17_015]|uniref:hypothetical protein n=1 Tax=Curtobacterium sp. MCSS17_015 TaxID=2175666 RepID=UPI0015E8D2F6|nr:hypothetical protein [Curtobacterium sp. MCSS17_015]WIB25177.1 hypothetical protein DEJ18_08815 [Curtobacterium sp. MCSS17_015]
MSTYRSEPDVPPARIDSLVRHRTSVRQAMPIPFPPLPPMRYSDFFVDHGRRSTSTD